MSRAGPPILAARAGADSSKRGEDSSSQNPGQNPSPSGKAKRTLIESACAACRKRKSRCDGARPKCMRCQNLRTECIYEAEEGESRWSALKRRNKGLEAERDDLRELLSWLRTKPEPEALEIYQRLRSGAYEDVMATVRDARRGVTQSQPGSTAVQGAPNERLPPIQTLMDVAGAGIARSDSVASDGSAGSYSSIYSASSQPTSA